MELYYWKCEIVNIYENQVASSLLCELLEGFLLPGTVQLTDDAEDDVVGRRGDPGW